MDYPAYTFCENRGLGLAIWDSSEAYEDLKYLSTTAVKSDLWTALTNEDNRNCYDQFDCDNKLLWRQTKTGPVESFQANSVYNK